MEELLARIIVEAVMFLAGIAITGLMRWLSHPPARQTDRTPDPRPLVSPETA